MTEHRTENDALIGELHLINRLHELDESGIWFDTVSGQVIDIRAKLTDSLSGRNPLRKNGVYRFAEPAGFIGYVQKHGLEQTELWGDRMDGRIAATIDAHAADHAGWGTHEAILTLEADRDWQDFMQRNGQMMTQQNFAEFIEDHLHVFAQPTAADMLELAQTFEATTRVEFQSSSRVKSGETQLHYAEHTAAGAGAKGKLAIPDTFTVGLTPFKGGELYKVEARFRYRIEHQTLLLGYKLVRPDKVRDEAFNQVVEDVASGLGIPVWQH